MAVHCVYTSVDSDIISERGVMNGWETLSVLNSYKLLINGTLFVFNFLLALVTLKSLLSSALHNNSLLNA